MNWIKEIFGLQQTLAERDMYKEENDSLRAERSALRAEQAALRALRNISWPKPAQRMPRPAVVAAFAEPLDRGLPMALHQELDDYLQDLLDQVSQAPSGAMTEATRLHLAGGIEHLRLFQKQLLDLHAESGREDADLEGKEDE